MRPRISVPMIQYADSEFLCLGTGVLVLRIRMPARRPRIPFPMILILRVWFPVMDLDSASEP